MQKGDLVYIPSETNIYKLDNSWPSTSWMVKHTSTLQEPRSFLLLGEATGHHYLKILVDGDVWYVATRDARKIENWEN
jgi:hypothetical protein